MPMKITKVYVRLLDEGSTAYRPSDAELLPNSTYKLISPSDYDPEDERWEFTPGSIVICEWTKLREGTYLVATAPASADVAGSDL